MLCLSGLHTPEEQMMNIKQVHWSCVDIQHHGTKMPNQCFSADFFFRTILLSQDILGAQSKKEILTVFLTEIRLHWEDEKLPLCR